MIYSDRSVKVSFVRISLVNESHRGIKLCSNVTCETGINMRYFNEEHDFSNEYQLFQDDAFECDSDFN